MGQGKMHREAAKGIISSSLDDLACRAIGACLEIRERKEDLWPSLFIQQADGQIEAISFKDDSLDICLGAARSAVKERGASIDRYAIGYDGSVQQDEFDPAIDAVIVEFGERGAPSAYSAYIPYMHDAPTGDFLTGEPLPGGEEPLLLH